MHTRLLPSGEFIGTIELLVDAGRAARMGILTSYHRCTPYNFEWDLTPENLGTYRSLRDNQ